MTDDHILETRSLVKEFKGFVAVNDVSLKVKRGSIHALIGPNGAGKTTCFNLLTKFLAPTRGSIHFNGTDITGHKPAQIARGGIIRSFQISAVFPHLTVLENVRVALQRKLGTSFHFWKSARTLDELNARAMELFEAVDLALSRIRLPWNCRTVASGRSKLRRRSRSIRSSCCSTSRPRAWVTRTSGRVVELIRKVAAGRTS